MLIDHLTFSRVGGAGMVARTLAETQISVGKDSRLVFSIETDLRSQPFSLPSITLGAALDQYLLSSKSKSTLISYFRSNQNPIKQLQLRDGSLVHLHWVEGVISHKRVEELLLEGRRVVWTLHDMAPFTGVCHHAHDCTEFERGCQKCPQTRKIFHAIPESSLKSKLLLSGHRNLRVIAPTEWLASRARRSSVMRGQNISVIPNPIDPVFFVPFSKPEARSILKVGPDALVGMCVAADLSDPNKNISQVTEAFLDLERKLGSGRVKLLLVGKNGQKHVGPITGGPIIWLGELNANELARLGVAADFIVSMATAESAGMTIKEGAALGLPAIAVASGGLSNMFKPGETGFAIDSVGELVSRVLEIAGGTINLTSMSKATSTSALDSHPLKVEKEYSRVYASLFD